MGKPTGFLEVSRQERQYGPVADRIHGYDEFVIALSEDEVSKQGSRCMDCGIPYCHTGCPVNNMIPDWNDLAYHKDWKGALDVLHSTNNFPEFTGRVCPAPCEASCTLNLTDEPVTIKTIECAIVDRGWAEGWIEPQLAEHKTGKSVAVVGAGPAGMACAQQLARAGYEVHVFERQNRMGGLLRFGIPDFKLNKDLISRRISQMRAEGVHFHPNTHIGVNMPAKDLLDKFDAVALTGGSEDPRDLDIPGRDLEGVEFAMDFLRQNNHRVAGDEIPEGTEIMATDKNVVVIGGGDTGSDCIGTSVRHGAKCVTQLEIMPQPPEKEDKGLTWPNWPMKMRTSSSQEEGCGRDFAVVTKEFIGQDGKLTGVRCGRVEWSQDNNGRWSMSDVEGSEFVLDAELVTLAMGFVHPVHKGMIEELGVELDPMGNIKGDTEGSDAYKSSMDKVFSAGDMRRGQSLVVWAIREGRQCARSIDEFLSGSSELPR